MTSVLLCFIVLSLTSVPRLLDDSDLGSVPMTTHLDLYGSGTLSEGCLQYKRPQRVLCRVRLVSSLRLY